MIEILKQYSILYAEDDKAVQKSTAEYLQRYFKEVYVASDGAEALALYQKCQPLVVMLDITMPRIDGLEVAKQIRTQSEETVIVMMTAHTDVERLLEATELNLCKYLVKPVKATAFKKALQKIANKIRTYDTQMLALWVGYVWDQSKEILYHAHSPVPLSNKEQLLLSLLIQKHDDGVCFEDIMAVVWQEDFEKEISLSSVKYQVSMLRKKLPEDVITNLYGKGYKLRF